MVGKEEKPEVRIRIIESSERNYSNRWDVLLCVELVHFVSKVREHSIADDDVVE